MATTTELSTAEATFNELQITSPDGHSLLVRRWSPADQQPIAEVLVLHGYMEHSGRYRELAHSFASHHIATTAVDLRGHGRADGPRGYVERFECYLDDAEAALALLGDGPNFILGHSNGGLVALDLVAARQPAVSGLIVTNPFLGLASDPGWLKRKVGQLAGRYRPTLSLPSGMAPAGISHDRGVVAAYERDPLVFTTANASWFREVVAAQERVRGFHQLPCPLLYVFSDSDPVAAPALNRALSAQLESPDKTVVERAGELHEVLNEVNRAQLHGEIARWIAQRAGQPA